LTWTFHTSDGRYRDLVARAQPIIEFAKDRERAICKIRSIGRDMLDQGDNIAALDAVDRAAAPRRQDQSVEDPLGRLGGGTARLAVCMEFQERRHHSFDAISRAVRGGRHHGLRGGYSTSLWR